MTTAKKRWHSWRELAHDFLGWHHPATPSPNAIDGLTVIATTKCELCGERIWQDSNGDWFVLDVFTREAE